MARNKKIMTIAELEARNAQQPNFGKGITVASGFDLGAKAPLDSRLTVKTIEERNAHVTGNRAYEGMLVYVEADKKTYQLIDGSWKPFGFDSEQFEAAVEDTLDSHSTTTALSANQGRVLNEKISAVASDLEALDTEVEGLTTTVENLEQTVQSNKTELEQKITTNSNAIQANTQAITAETSRAEAAEQELAERLDTLEGEDSVVGSVAHSVKTAKEELEAQIDALSSKTTQDIADAKSEAITESKGYTDLKVSEINTASGQLADRVTALESKDLQLEQSISNVDAKADANAQAIAQEKSDRESAITTVTGRVENVENALATETSERQAADTLLQGKIETVDGRVDALEEMVNSIETDWASITDKPFETLGTSLEVSGSTLDVKVDGVTLEKSETGAVKVKDGVFSLEGHNHDELYASKAHEENQEIHLTSEEKVNVGKIPTLVSDVDMLKATVSGASTHIIVETVEELEALKATCNHATIAHVIATNETYILEKDSDSNGNSITPEWIKLSDSDALVSVDWNVINSKPFSTVSEGLTVEGDALKVSTDEATIEIADGKIKVKDGIFADADHDHVIDFNDIINKPVAFTKSYAVENFVDGTEEDAGLVYLVVDHNKNSKNLKVTAVGNDSIERFIGIEYTSENSIKVWSDVKENLTVTVNCLDFTTNEAAILKAIASKTKVSSK